MGARLKIVVYRVLGLLAYSSTERARPETRPRTARAATPRGIEPRPFGTREWYPRRRDRRERPGPSNEKATVSGGFIRRERRDSNPRPPA